VNVSAPFIARPIATSLLAVALLLAGLLGYRALPVASLPSVDFPTILITTRLPGANPQTMARLITAPLERQFGDIAGLDAMNSVSTLGMSAITLRFSLHERLDSAAQAVQAAINAAAATLPPNLPYPPVYSEVNPADAPIIVLALTSQIAPIAALANAANTLLQPKLSEVSGVGQVRVAGNMKKAIRVHIDPTRLAAYGLSLEDVRTALTAANQNGPKGGFEGRAQAFSLGANDQIQTPRDFNQVVLASVHGAPVTIGDVGSVSDGLQNEIVAASFNGIPAVLLTVYRAPGANIVNTVGRIVSALPALQKTLPPGLKLAIVANRTATIQASVADVRITLMTSVVLVILVIFLFLPTWRAAIIPAASLPLSLIGTFAVMHSLGFSLDNLSLMALTVASGFVVDDAIVMIENVVRYIEAGLTPKAAAIEGARQIGFTIVSLTISLIAVFIPLLFMPGLVGRLFREFSMTLSIAVAMSAFISLTLTPMMCAYILPPAQAKSSRSSLWIEQAWVALRSRYRDALLWVLRRRAQTIGAVLFTIVASIGLFLIIPKGLLPEQDTSEIAIATSARGSISLPAFRSLETQAVTGLLKNPAVAGVTSFIGTGLTNPTPNSGRLTVVLKPIGKRPPLRQVETALHHTLAAIPGLRVIMQPVQDITLSSRLSPAQYQYTLTDTSRARVDGFARRLVQALRPSPLLRDITSNTEGHAIETLISIERARAAALGVSMQTIENTLYDAFGQRQISTIYTQNNQYRVVLGVDRAFRQHPTDLMSLYVPGRGGAQIPLSEIADIHQRRAALSINQENQFPSATVSFNLAPHTSLGQAERYIQKEQQKLHKPRSITGVFTGAAAQFRSALAHEPALILGTLVVIYIVLGILYESVIHPLTILSTLPSAGVGALLALFLSHTEFTIVALVGIVLLMGIVKKNGIMIVDFAIEATRKGATPEEAIVEASVLRFRPILMTTLAALFGALPLILEGGAGAELRVPLGIAIIGGLLISQLLTLFTTPVIYLTLERIRRPSWLGQAPALSE